MENPQGNPELLGLILDEIRTHGLMPFVRFMDLALYHPEHGYYNARARVFGRGGDYYTSADLHPAFGALLARQCQDMWQALGRPAQFTIVEMGAGRGFLCRDLLAHLRESYADCFSATRYIIDERSAARRAEQSTLLKSNTPAGRVAWRPLGEIPENSVTGVFLSNELVDAFPVHRVRMTGHGLQEQFVEERETQLHLTWDTPSTDELVQYLNSMNIALQPGQTAEINLAARQWMRDVAARLERGFAITMDYGHPAPKLYSPARPAGALMCYHMHEAAHDPLARIGEQDMTAHVNFTDLIRTGERHGLRNAGFTRQMFFLGSLGLDEFAARARDTRDPGSLLKSNMAFKNLIDPAGLGGFGVLLQCKGFADIPALRGLRFNPQLRNY
jgi:SAM-dependent MidA family methyltransferase